MIAALALAAAVAVGPPAPPAAERAQTLALRWDESGKRCVAAAGGVEIGDIATDEGRAALAVSVPDKGAALRLLGGASVPYACMADLTDALRRIGHYGAVGFVAQPFPAAPGR